MSFDRTTTVVQQNSAQLRNVTVTYDSAMDTYTVARTGQTERFDPSQRVESANNATRLAHDTAQGTEFLTIVKGPADGPANEAVTLGLWQSARLVGANQINDVDVFVFGRETLPGAIPLTGKAGYRTDIFGLLSEPGRGALTFYGETDLTLDLGRGTFWTVGQVAEGVVLTRSFGNGPFPFSATGRLSASTNDFTGHFYYSGSQRIGGELVGHLFGTTGQELGMVFSGTDPRGVTFSGGLTARRDDTLIENLTVADVTSPTSFLGGAARFTLWQSASTGAFDTVSRQLSDISVTDDGSPPLAIPQLQSNLVAGNFTAADAAPSPVPEYLYWQRTEGAFTLGLLVDNPASGSVPLTYLDFGVFRSEEHGTFFDFEENFYFHYGVRNPIPLSYRTGRASYSGIVRGEAAGKASRTRYDLTGSSQFAFDFDNGQLAGTLQVTGRDRSSGAQTALGNYTFADTAEAFITGVLLESNGETRGELRGFLYGPDISELGASFGLSIGPTFTGDQLVASGITVATLDDPAGP